jgi:hypothetical protein
MALNAWSDWVGQRGGDPSGMTAGRKADFFERPHAVEILARRGGLVDVRFFEPPGLCLSDVSGIAFIHDGEVPVLQFSAPPRWRAATLKQIADNEVPEPSFEDLSDLKPYVTGWPATREPLPKYVRPVSTAVADLDERLATIAVCDFLEWCGQ